MNIPADQILVGYPHDCLGSSHSLRTKIRVAFFVENWSMQPGGYGEKAFLTLRVSQEVLRRWNGDGESSGLSLGIEA